VWGVCCLMRVCAQLTAAHAGTLARACVIGTYKVCSCSSALWATPFLCLFSVSIKQLRACCCQYSTQHTGTVLVDVLGAGSAAAAFSCVLWFLQQAGGYTGLLLQGVYGRDFWVTSP
jgi:hypothetical protein